jgi:nitric oxide reductase subunit C
MTLPVRRPPLLAWGTLPLLLAVMPTVYLTLGPTATAADLAAEGRQLTFSRGCTQCHRLDGQGTALACDLDRVGRRRAKAWLHLWLADPAAVRPGTAMPRPSLTWSERLAVAEFLAGRQ